MAEVGDLLPIDDNNTARWPEGMPPSDVNNAGRADEGIMSRWHRDTNGSLTSTGTSTAYTLTTNQSIAAYYDGFEVTFKAHVACGDSPTLQVGALAAAALQNADGTALSAGDIPADSIVNFISQDNATTPTWRLMSPPISVSDPITTEGDLIIGDSGGGSIRLPIGAAGSSLTSNGTTATWSQGVVNDYIQGLVLSNNATLPNTDLDIASGSAASDDNSTTIVLQSGLTKKLNAAFSEGNNQGGLDTGARQANSWYHFFAISKADGQADALFSLSFSSPTLPAGFVNKRRVGAVLTDGSQNIIAFYQQGDKFIWDVPVADITLSGGATTRTNATLTVPTGLKLEPIFTGYARATSGSNVVYSVIFTSPDQTDTAPDENNAHVIAQRSASDPAAATKNDVIGVFTNTSAQIAHRASSAIVSFSITTRGWIDPRGRS